MKKLFAVILSIALCFGLLAGCGANGGDNKPGSDPAPGATSQNGGSSAEAPGADTSNGATVGVLVVTTQSQWCNDLIAGVKEVCDANGMQVIVSDSQVSVDQEISGMENLINAGCSAIVVNCMNAAGLADLCKQAQDKGIYIIGWSEELGYYDAMVVEDKPAQSGMVADAIESYISAKGLEKPEMAAIWLADSNNPDTNAGQYKAAQESVFEERLVNGLGVSIVNSQYAADTNAAMNVAEAILAANPNVKVIFTQSDEMGVAVAQVVEAKGIAAGDILIVGLDGTAEAISNIAAGSNCMGATIYVDTVTIGRGCGNSIVNYLTDGTKADVVTEYTLIDAGNAADYVAAEN